jgi:1,2-dihydroxy-3-keto-5-methylthiopentene dioxygenase
VSLLIVSSVNSADRERSSTREASAIAERLAGYGVRFGRWPLRSVPAGGDVMATYAPEIARLTAEGGYASVDVVRMAPDASDPEWPAKAAAARAKFLAEHTHAEDEVRFFAEGSALFYLRFGDDVAMVLCEAGDVISVPAGTRHWFDMGTAPSFCAVRFFGRPDGWVATFTGDDVATRFPSFDRVRGAHE